MKSKKTTKKDISSSANMCSNNDIETAKQQGGEKAPAAGRPTARQQGLHLPGKIWHSLCLVLRHIFTMPILIYQKVISPWLPDSCIYYPSCSEYSRQSILRFGIFRGVVAALLRIFRCAGGLFTGGVDEVPGQFSFRDLAGKYSSFRKKRKHKQAQSAKKKDGNNIPGKKPPHMP